MELLDTAIANVSLPHIAGGLATSYDDGAYQLSGCDAVVLPLGAWLSRVFGRKNYYMTCVALFNVSSLMCGLAPSLGMLIFFRVLQGIGGGGLAPVEQAILVDPFPPAKCAAAFALYSMAIVTAPAIGPHGSLHFADARLRWKLGVERADKVFSNLSEDQLLKEVAPGRNRLISGGTSPQFTTRCFRFLASETRTGRYLRLRAR